MALVVQLVGHQRLAEAVVVVVPAAQGVAQGGHFGACPHSGPCRAFAGMGRKSGQYQQREEQHPWHGQHPCVAE
ncbi:hypothetical protein D3C76_1668800 [compost metagenome]